MAVRPYPITLISDCIRSEQALAQQREALHQALSRERELCRQRTEFLRRLDRELRTPLAIVQLSAELLLNYGEHMPEHEQRQRLETVYAEARRISDLIEHIKAVTVEGDA